LYVALKAGVVVKERRARAEVMKDAGAGVGAAEKRVRVDEGRRKKEAKSLEAIVAVPVRLCWFGCARSFWEMRGRGRRTCDNSRIKVGELP